MTKPAKMTMANFLIMPQTETFLSKALGEKKSEFISNMIAITDSDANLANCDPSALVKCAMNATALNLPLNKNLGYAYIIPYGGVPQFQIGYKGLIQLAIRTGMYEVLNSCEIREGEIRRNKITGSIDFIGENEKGKIVGYLSYLKLKSGFSASLYMTNAEIEAHALRYSKSYAYDVKNKKMSSKWSDSHARPKMAMKTVLKGLIGTYGVLTHDLASAIENDSDYEGSSGSGRTIDSVTVIEETDDGEPETIKL